MHMQAWSIVRAAGIAWLLSVAACQGTPRTEEGQGGVGFVRGLGVVVSVNEQLGQAVLEVEGRRVNAYWQIETSMAQPGQRVQAGPLKPAVGQYREPVVKVERFPGKPGETIEYVGIKTGPDIYLRGVAVVGP